VESIHKSLVLPGLISRIFFLWHFCYCQVPIIERDEEEWPSAYPGVISSTMREGGVEEGISIVPDLLHPPMPSIA